MSVELDRRLRGRGTKFKLFAQSPTLADFSRPETVWVSSPRGSLQPGPADKRMYVVDAVSKSHYEGDVQPPYRGARLPAVEPGPAGHFDHIAVDAPAFRSAHCFGVVRRVLDIWEDYYGASVPWHFEPYQRQLEIIPWVDWKNAQFGWGFLEAGYGLDDEKKKQPFSLNFDVLAHETGHSLIFSIVGFPNPRLLTAEYRGFHESASDLVALISAMHFESFLDHTLAKTRGNLYRENELNRIGELSETRQIRLACNEMTMSDVPDRHRAHSDLTSKEIHTLGQPLTGALFDIMLEVFQQQLVAFGAIDEDLAERAGRDISDESEDEAVAAAFAAAYEDAPYSFRDALVEARDFLGPRLALTWRELRPENLTFAKVAQTFLSVDRRLSGARNQKQIVECFRWREIGFGYSAKPLTKT